ncbi:MAG: DUF493 domain-containing protein [Spartobacteria bacterium]|nr:DUF493 domain-containing protein [Spartobacteria bacterium]
MTSDKPTQDFPSAMCGKTLEFPLQCHFKVIALQGSEIKKALEGKLAEIGVEQTLEAGNTSAKGTFTTYNFSMMVGSRKEMGAIDAALRSCEGVRMVL